MAGLELFHTRARANEGVRLPLYAPDGSPTEHWLQVRHVWSDAFQEANDVAVAEVSEAVLAAQGDLAKIAAAKREAQIRLWTALVAAWSFDEPCTPENVAAWLREAPQIGKVLDKFAADSKRFFGNDSTSSTAGSSQSES